MSIDTKYGGRNGNGSESLLYSLWPYLCERLECYIIVVCILVLWAYDVVARLLCVSVCVHVCLVCYMADWSSLVILCSFHRKSRLLSGNFGISHIRYLYFLYFWATARGAQGLLLILQSGITPGSVQDTIWDAGNPTWDGYMQGNCPICSNIAPAF